METGTDAIRKPKDWKEVFWWMVFEPILLEKWSGSLKTIRQRWLAIREPYFYLSLFLIGVWLLAALVLAGFDLPGRLPSYFNTRLTANWSSNFAFDFVWYLQVTWKVLAGGLAFGLAFGLRSVPAFGLAFGLAGGLVGGLTFGLVVVLAVGLAVGLALGLGFGLVLGLAFGLALGLDFGLVFGLAVSLAGGLAVGLSVGLAGGLAGGLAFYFMYFRLPFYGWYSLKNSFFKKYNLSKNPHRWDWGISFPIYGLQKQLTEESFEKPEEGKAFAIFLLNERRYQNNLAWSIAHATEAGHIRQNRLDFKALDTGGFPESAKKYRPTEAWYERLDAMYDSLSDSLLHSNIHQKIAFFEEFQQRMEKFTEQNRLEPREWSQYYDRAMQVWQRAANEEHARLLLEAENAEPVAKNPFRGGEKLDPRTDQALFLGRDDLQQAFKNRVLSAADMPLFFIQGQRRVGKSSLISFLPGFLGSGFAVVPHDLQDGVPSVQVWLGDVRKAVHRHLNRLAEPPVWQPADGWLDCWRQFADEMDGLAAADGRRLVLAIDEYEELHRCLQRDPEQAATLLGAMRAWTQRQNRVVLLFAGADFFSELKNPNWNEYFPQAERLHVDYLHRADTHRLITIVLEVRYPTALLDRMFDDTAGHPALLHKICGEIVKQVNLTAKRDIDDGDYEKALAAVVFQPTNGVIDLFWWQFCELRGLQPMVEHLVLTGELTDERAIVVLKSHGFIVKTEVGGWRLRVPLFESWVREFRFYG